MGALLTHDQHDARRPRPGGHGDRPGISVVPRCRARVSSVAVQNDQCPRPAWLLGQALVEYRPRGTHSLCPFPSAPSSRREHGSDTVNPSERAPMRSNFRGA